MRYFWDIHNFPGNTRILLVESGSRELLEKAIPTIRTFWDGITPPIDVLTCFPGVPEGIGDDGQIYRVADYPGPERKKLLRELKDKGYAIMGIVCSEEAILFKWKCLIVASVPAKMLVIRVMRNVAERASISGLRVTIRNRSCSYFRLLVDNSPLRVTCQAL